MPYDIGNVDHLDQLDGSALREKVQGALDWYQNYGIEVCLVALVGAGGGRNALVGQITTDKQNAAVRYYANTNALTVPLNDILAQLLNRAANPELQRLLSIPPEEHPKNDFILFGNSSVTFIKARVIGENYFCLILKTENPGFYCNEAMDLVKVIRPVVSAQKFWTTGARQ